MTFISDVDFQNYVPGMLLLDSARGMPGKDKDSPVSRRMVAPSTLKPGSHCSQSLINEITPVISRDPDSLRRTTAQFINKYKMKTRAPDDERPEKMRKRMRWWEERSW